ncbi:MAG: flagellar hook-basal body complex protein FliE [Alphaproteobacteria bacterium]|nr:flagellar hook-basal body complex protein FliE [Alphaproteobacteria bacterium]
MSVSPTSASQAYLNTLRNAGSGGVEPRGKSEDFGQLLNEFVKSSVETARAGETASIKGLAGTADVAEVVTAVTNAEVALQTVVAIRDRVIQAYQDIVRMPI